MARTIFLALPFLTFHFGCAAYNVMSLEPFQPEFHPSAQNVGSVSVCCEPLDVTASKRYFNRDIASVGYQPVQFTIVNGPERVLEFRLSHVSLPSAPADHVAEKCHFNTAARATTYGVIGIIIWPFLIPAIVDGVGSSKANTQMDYDFASKVLKDQVINPHGMTNGVVFVPKEQYREDITLKLLDKAASEVLVFRWVAGKPVSAMKKPFGSMATSAKAP